MDKIRSLTSYLSVLSNSDVINVSHINEEVLAPAEPSQPLVGDCDIDFFNFRHRKVRKFKSVQMKLKFCSHLLKVLKANLKVYKVL